MYILAPKAFFLILHLIMPPPPQKNKTKMSHVDPQIYIDLYCPPQDYTEDYVQTGPGQLYAYSTRLFTVDGIGVPYTWNHTVSYDQARGRMPFLVETLHASSVESDYNQLEETLGFKIHASISKGNLLEGESRYSQKSQWIALVPFKIRMLRHRPNTTTLGYSCMSPVLW